MKTEIITINDKQYTRIYKPINFTWLDNQIQMGNPVVLQYRNRNTTQWVIEPCIGRYEHCYICYEQGGDECWLDAEEIMYTITTLPALPRYPKAEDAALLYRYMSEGLMPMSDLLYQEYEDAHMWDKVFILHSYMEFVYGSKIDDENAISCCINEAGERVEVAIL